MLGAVAGVGDTRFGHRVSQQEFRRLALVAVLARQALEHVGHGARVVAGADHGGDADAVGLLLVLPGEAQLVLDRCGLGAGDGSDTGVAGTRCGGNNAGQHGGHHRYLHALLRLDATGEVALAQVAEFVCQYCDVFAFGLGIDEQAAIDADHAARGGKGVDLFVADQDEGQAVVLQFTGLRQAVNAGLDVILELRVVERIDLVAQHAQPGAAELEFLLRRDDGRAGIAQRRQVVRQGRRGEGDSERQQGRAEYFHVHEARSEKGSTLAAR